MEAPQSFTVDAALAGKTLAAAKNLGTLAAHEEVPIADSVMSYAVRMVTATRPGETKEIEGIHKYLLYGASPRASQYLVLGAKARAILAGKYHVDFDDIKNLAGPVLRHRLVLNFHARADGVDSDAIIRRLVETIKLEA